MFNGPARSNVSERTTAGRNDLASLSRGGVILADNKFRYDWGLVLLLWLACVAWVGVRLPIEAIPTGDSNAYLTLASYRPPVYGWVLHIYRWMTGGLDYLPALQLFLFASGLLIFAIELGRLLESAFVAAAAILLSGIHVVMHQAPSWLMSESVFELLVLTGLGLQFRYARCGGVVAGAGAAACFALAAGTRTSGAAFLLIPLLTTWLDHRQRMMAAAIRTGQVALAGVLVLALVMAGNWLKNDRFEIGSWTGISLLGKGLLLVRPSDVPNLPPPVAAVAPTGQYLRELIKEQPDLAARLRAQDQAYQDLRFPLFYPAAEGSWPDWAKGDWQTRGELALALSRTVIERHPWEYVKLWANDWLSLVLYPQHWPKWATAQADGSLFPACRLHDNCWVLSRDEVPAKTLLDMLIVSLAGTIGGGLVLIFCVRRVILRRADPKTALFWTIALVLQVSLLGTSAFEAGLVRYTDITHLLGVALLLWFASMLPLQVAPSRWLGPRFGWPSFFSRGEFLFSSLYLCRHFFRHSHVLAAVLVRSTFVDSHSVLSRLIAGCSCDGSAIRCVGLSVPAGSPVRHGLSVKLGPRVADRARQHRPERGVLCAGPSESRPLDECLSFGLDG